MTTEDLSPLMKQFQDLKSQVPDCLLLFRMGDFYELFGEDAVVASKILEITLTSRDKNKAQPIPMAGVPHHSVSGYIQRLLKAGKKIAIGEQMEDAATAKAGKTIVRREIVRVLTPAVQFDHAQSESAYLATIVSSGNDLGVLACLDISTGDLRVSLPTPTEKLLSDLWNLPIQHFLIHHDLCPELRSAYSAESGVLTEELASNYLSLAQAEEVLKNQYGISCLDTFFTDSDAVRASGILITYVLKTQRLERIGHLRFPEALHPAQTLVLGPRTPQHLDLISTDGPSLFTLINRTRSSLGARTLRRWLLEPLRSLEDIQSRQRAIGELGANEHAYKKCSEQLAHVYDLERILGRVAARVAQPRDTLALARSLAIVPSLIELLGSLPLAEHQELSRSLLLQYQKISELVDRILKIQKEEAPLVSRDGGIFKTGTTPELDRLIGLNENGERWLIDLEARERSATGIASLKVRYNRVFGYYIEITQAHLDHVPAHYQRKQTMVGAERFFTEELKKFEEEILTASSKQKQLEQELFENLVQEIATQSTPLMELASQLALLDTWTALASLVNQPGWVFPQLDESLDLKIRAGRHPLVDPGMRGKFVPNDISFDENRKTLLITGPNMGGKSTVMRQVALIIILGQMGAPVPALEARWGLFSSIYTRIGAQDAIARGQSTFMIEMSELAHILHHADNRSLLVLDEIGRGTSTYDGISVAWAALEWIGLHIKARTLFSTHYHELTRLESQLPAFGNMHLAVEGAKALQGGTLRFLYLLREGPSAESFGIHVAQLAGLPQSVVSRAWKVLEELERKVPGAELSSENSTPSSPQLSLFDLSAPALPATPPDWIVDLSAANLNEMTPVQALNFLVKIQGEVKEQSSSAAGAYKDAPYR